MNQKFGQIRKRDLTCKELLATGVTLGEHNRRLRAERASRVLATSILIFILFVVFFVLGVLPAVAG
jgi:t-SNARE complex subunit (syntaxin)